MPSDVSVHLLRMRATFVYQPRCQNGGVGWPPQSPIAVGAGVFTASFSHSSTSFPAAHCAVASGPAAAGPAMFVSSVATPNALHPQSQKSFSRTAVADS